MPRGCRSTRREATRGTSSFTPFCSTRRTHFSVLVLVSPLFSCWKSDDFLRIVYFSARSAVVYQNVRQILSQPSKSSTLFAIQQSICKLFNYTLRLSKTTRKGWPPRRKRVMAKGLLKTWLSLMRLQVAHYTLNTIHTIHTLLPPIHTIHTIHTGLQLIISSIGPVPKIKAGTGSDMHDIIAVCKGFLKQGHVQLQVC